MKAVPVLALLLLLSVSAAAQSEKPYQIDSEYDRFKDITRNVLEPMPTTLPNVFLTALYDCPGRQSCKPEAVVLGFAIVNLSEEYRGPGVARAIRDGTRQDPYQLEYMGLLRPTPFVPLVSHLFRAFLKPDGIAKIANSRLVEYQIDTYEFALTSNNLAGLRDLAGRMQ